MKNKPNCDASGHFPSSVVRMGKMTKISSQMTRRVSCFGHWRHYIAMKRHTCLKLCHILSSRTKDGGVTAKCQHSTTGAGCWKIRTLHTPVSDFTPGSFATLLCYMCVILFYQKDMLIPLLSLTKKYDIRDFPWTSNFKMKL